MIDDNNPPEMKVEFFSEQKISNINCFSNEIAGWDNSKLEIEGNILRVLFRDKFKTRRGRINCSVKDTEGWRWFGVQFVLKNIKKINLNQIFCRFTVGQNSNIIKIC